MKRLFLALVALIAIGAAAVPAIASPISGNYPTDCTSSPIPVPGCV
jgi:hypothetical protein